MSAKVHTPAKTQFPDRTDAPAGGRTSYGAKPIAAKDAARQKKKRHPASEPDDGRLQPMHARLFVSAHDDPLEREADVAATHVLGPRSPRATDRPLAAPLSPTLARLTGLSGARAETMPLLSSGHGRGGKAGGAPDFHQRLAARRGNGAPIPAPAQRYFSDRFRFNFNAVRVHTGHDAAALARAVSARAFTSGKDIVFDHQEYAPNTDEGLALLGHELAHVVQQSRLPFGSPPLIQRRGVPGQPDLVSKGAADIAAPAAEDSAEKRDDADEQEAAHNNAGTDVHSDQNAKVQKAASDKNVDLAENAPIQKDAKNKATAAADKTGSEETENAKAEVAPEPKDLSDLSSGELDLIDEELAEHQRWAGASAIVGAAGSEERAEFVMASVLMGEAGGFGSGFAEGAKIGGLTRAAEYATGKAATAFAAKFGTQAAKFTPLPAVGAVIGGAISAYELIGRDWEKSGETIGRFGQGAETYEKLANSIAAISEILDVATQIMNVIAGVIGAIAIASWAIAIATVGVASPLSATLTAIATGIGIASLIIDAINAVVLKQLVVVFRALHAFSSDADPEDVVVQGEKIAEAAGAASGFLGGFAGGMAASKIKKGKPKIPATEAKAPHPDHPNPAPATGEGPTVKGEPPVASAAPAAKDTVPVEPPIESPASKAEAAMPSPAAEAPASMAEATKSSPAQALAPAEPLPSKGQIVAAAMLQFWEKFAEAGVQPKERAKIARMIEAAERQRAKLESLESSGAPEKTIKRARAKYEKKIGEIHERRQKQRQAVIKEFLETENIDREELVPADEFEKAFDEQFGDLLQIGPEGKPLEGPLTEPSMTLPFEVPDLINAPAKSGARPGLTGRMGHLPPAEGQFVREHITPGEQWKLMLQTGKLQLYDKATHYTYDITMLLPKEMADIKTYEGPNADYKRLARLQESIAKGEPVDVWSGQVLPSILQTFFALDTYQQRKLAESASAPPAGSAEPVAGSPETSAAPGPEIPKTEQPANLADIPEETRYRIAEPEETRYRVAEPELMETEAEIEESDAGLDAPVMTAHRKLNIIRPGGAAAAKDTGPGFWNNLTAFAHEDLASPSAGKAATLAIGGPTALFAGWAGRKVGQGFTKASAEPVYERVNPHYPPPPGTPQDHINAKNELQRILQERATVEAAEEVAVKEEDKSKANQEPLKKGAKATQDAISATEAHKRVVARRDAANTKANAKEKEVGVLSTEFVSRSSRLVAVTAPMRAFERFTYLATYLPDSPDVLKGAKRSILKVHSDSAKFLKALENVELVMRRQSAQQPQRAQVIDANAGALKKTDQNADASAGSLHNADTGTQTLAVENKANLTLATQMKAQAAKDGQNLDAQAAQKAAQAEAMAAAWRSWSQRHRQARLDALEQTKKNMEQAGYRNIEMREH